MKNELKPDERRSRILTILTHGGHVFVSDLAKQFDVTGQTIRTDLVALRKENPHIQKKQGGAILDSVKTSPPQKQERSIMPLQQNSGSETVFDVYYTIFNDSVTLEALEKPGSIFFPDFPEHEAMIAIISPMLGNKHTIVTNSIPLGQEIAGKTDAKVEFLLGSIDKNDPSRIITQDVKSAFQHLGIHMLSASFHFIDAFMPTDQPLFVGCENPNDHSILSCCLNHTCNHNFLISSAAALFEQTEKQVPLNNTIAGLFHLDRQMPEQGHAYLAKFTGLDSTKKKYIRLSPNFSAEIKPHRGDTQWVNQEKQRKKS